MERRTTKDLVNELREEAKGAKIAALVVGFEKETKYVWNQSPDPLHDLNALIEAGGEPVGISRIICAGGQIKSEYQAIKGIC